MPDKGLGIRDLGLGIRDLGLGNERMKRRSLKIEGLKV
jgi:hypothetical protein